MFNAKFSYRKEKQPSFNILCLLMKYNSMCFLLANLTLNNLFLASIKKKVKVESSCETDSVECYFEVHNYIDPLDLKTKCYVVHV